MCVKKKKNILHYYVRSFIFVSWWPFRLTTELMESKREPICWPIKISVITSVVAHIYIMYIHFIVCVLCIIKFYLQTKETIEKIEKARTITVKAASFIRLSWKSWENKKKIKASHLLNSKFFFKKKKLYIYIYDDI